MLPASAPHPLAKFASLLCAGLGLWPDAYAQTPPEASHAQLVAETRRTPAELKRRPDGLEEVEAITRGASVPAWPTAVAFHPDGTRIALIDDRGTVDLWHWEENRHIRREVAAGYDHQVAFSRDGTTLIAAEGEGGGYLHLWNAQNGALQAQLGRSPVGLWIQEPSRFWQLGDRLLAFLPTPVAEYREKKRFPAMTTTASPALPPILSEIRDRRQTKTWTPATPIHAFHVSAAGRWLAFVVSREQGTALSNSLTIQEPTLSLHGAVEIYDLDSGQRRAVLHPQGTAAFSVSSSSDGRLLITSSYQTSQQPSARQHAEIWDAGSGRRLARIAGESPHLMLSLLLPPAFPITSGDGRWLVFAQGARHVLWDAQTRRTRALSTTWGSAAFVAGTSLLIDAPSPCVRAPVTVWDLANDRRIPLQNPTSTRYPAPIDGVDCPRWRPWLDSPFLDRGRTPPRSAAHVGVGLVAVWHFSYGSSGTGGYHVYGPEGDSAIRLFDLRTGAVWATLGPHDAPVRFVEFSRDGRLVLTVDAEANMRLWRVQPASADPPPPSVPPPPPEIGWRRLEP